MAVINVLCGTYGGACLELVLRAHHYTFDEARDLTIEERAPAWRHFIDLPRKPLFE